MRWIETADKICEQCKRPFNRGAHQSGRPEGIEDYRKRRFCSKQCCWQWKTGDGNHRWKGGIRRGHDGGYLRVTDGRYVHRIAMEKKLGRPLLSDEHVHHKDGNVLNNDPGNLELVSNSEHRRLHNATAKRDRMGRYSA